jgi:hypothetical protein
MKGSYASLHELQPDHDRKAALLQQVRQFLQRQALLPSARQSEGCQDLLAVRFKGFEYAAAKSLTSSPPLCFSAWPWTRISVFGRRGNLSRFLYPQALDRSKRTIATDVYWFSARSLVAPLDDAAKGTARAARRDWKADLQEEEQGSFAQALKDEERCSLKDQCGGDWVGSRISRMFRTPHGYCST